MVKKKTRWAAAAAVAATAGMVAATVAAGAPPAAAATKAAFVIGMYNANQGVVTLPGIADGAQAAVQYVNATGGINGHPLVLKTMCEVDATPEKNQACGQQLANDSQLKMIVSGFTLAAGPMFSTLSTATAPIIEAYPVSSAEFTASNAVAYTGGAVAASVGGAELANYDKAQTVAFMLQDSQTAQASENYYRARFKGPQAGIKVVLVPATATDALPYLLQGGAATADVVQIGLGNCLPFARALSQLRIPGTKVHSTPVCVSPTNIQGPSGSLFEGWRMAFNLQDPGFGPITPDLRTLINEYPKYAKLPTSPAWPTYVAQGWASVMNIQKVLRGQPDSVLNDKKALFNVFHSYRGPAVLGGPSMKCGSVKGQQALCTTWTMKGQNRGGKYYRVAG